MVKSDTKDRLIILKPFNRFVVIKNTGIDTYHDMVVTNMEFIDLFWGFAVAPKVA